jgi:hypothetical protein
MEQGTTTNNGAPNPELPCSAVAGRRHCEWIRANNTPLPSPGMAWIVRL